MELSIKQLQKYKGKDIPQLLKIAEKHFNLYIRKRDSNGGDYFQCISCGQYKRTEMMHAGHYKSAGHNGTVRFNPDNVHGQCSSCNTHLHGNLIKYRENLVKKIGLEKVEFIEAIARASHKWDREGLIFTIERYKAKLK